MQLLTQTRLLSSDGAGLRVTASSPGGQMLRLVQKALWKRKQTVCVKAWVRCIQGTVRSPGSLRDGGQGQFVKGFS